jgi:thioredoxin 1
MTKNITSAEFKEKIFDFDINEEWAYKGDLPAIVDFYADWCGPCKMVAPVLEELSGIYDGKIHIYKVNTDTEGDLAQAFGIQSIPSLLFIPKTGAPQMAAGALPKAGLVKFIKEVLQVE